MANFKMISANSHIVEPPDMYTERIDPKLRDRAPRMERRKTPAGREYDAWMLDGQQVGTLGAVMQAGQRFEDPSQIDFLGVWDDVRKGAYDPHAMIVENEQDGIWGSVLQPSQGLFWYRVPDSRLLVRDLPRLQRLDRRFLQAVSRPAEGHRDAQSSTIPTRAPPNSNASPRWAWSGRSSRSRRIPTSPTATRSTTVSGRWREELKHPLLLHIGTPRDGIPANEFTMDVTELTGAGRSTTDYWVRYSLGSMVFAGVFDKFPGLKIGSVEHEAAWIPHWLKQMDFTYLERPVFTKGWRSKEGLLPSDYWKRNMFVEFMEDDLGVQLRDRIGVENMLWGSDYPHAEATFPRSQQFLQRMFAGVPEADLRKITSENAAKMFGFQLN